MCNLIQREINNPLYIKVIFPLILRGKSLTQQGKFTGSKGISQCIFFYYPRIVCFNFKHVSLFEKIKNLITLSQWIARTKCRERDFELLAQQSRMNKRRLRSSPLLRGPIRPHANPMCMPLNTKADGGLIIQIAVIKKNHLYLK